MMLANWTSFSNDSRIMITLVVAVPRGGAAIGLRVLSITNPNGPTQHEVSVG